MSLDERLRSAMDTMAESIELEPDRDLVVARRRGRRRLRSRRLSAVAGCLALVGGVAVAGWQLAGDDDGGQTVTAVEPTPVPDREPLPTEDPTVLAEEDSEGAWIATSSSPISGRLDGVVVEWTGTEVLVWGGTTDNTPTAAGAAYDPSSDTWREFATDGAWAVESTSVWTGQEMIVWGGRVVCPPGAGCAAYQNNTFSYDPDRDQFNGRGRAIAPVIDRVSSVSVWTGEEMIVWGGFQEKLGADPVALGDGAVYEPSTDTWEPIPANPFGQRGTAIVGHHDGALVLGGGEGGTDSDSGWYRYDLDQREWSDLPDPPANLNLLATGVQVGDQLVVWNGTDPVNPGGGDGAILDLGSGTWRSMAHGPGGQPFATDGVTIGRRAIFLLPDEGAIALYDLDSDTWTRTMLPGWLVAGGANWLPRTLTQAGPGQVMVWNEATGRGATIDIDAIASTHPADDDPTTKGTEFVSVPWPQLNSGLPLEWLGVQASGELVLVDTADQTITETYGSLGDPTQGPTPDEGSNFIDAAWRVPGTDLIYVSECCEPAGGNGIYIDPDTTVTDRVSAVAGHAAVPSPDGTLIAVPQNVGLYLSGAEPFSTGSHISDTGDFGAGSVAWLQDRRGVVWAPVNNDGLQVLEVVELDDDNQPVGVRVLPQPDLWGLTVAVRSDGGIVVAGCDRDRTRLQCESSKALILDPDSGQTVDEFAIEPGARLGGYDFTSTYLIYTDRDGTARWRGAGQAGSLGNGYIWASW